MATYKDAGVDIILGDECSRIAYEAAKSTFPGRKGRFGQAVILEGGFTGALDFGDYYLVQNDDGVGTKVIIADAVKKWDTLGYDLAAMVADDAACVGAEVLTISNVIDIHKVEKEKISQLMSGLAKVCLEQNIIIPGGEIAELGDLVNGFSWNATAIGVVEKDKFITTDKVQAGDKIIGLASRGFRSNGFSLIRHVLKQTYGENWYYEKFDDKRTWGEAVLTPSIVYHSAIMDMHGRFKEPSKAEIKAVAHITGGGLPGNIARVLKKNNLGADLNNLPVPHDMMLKLQDLDTVKDSEAYKTWNMGIGMAIVSNDTEKIIEIAKNHGIKANVIGEIVKEPGIRLVSKGYFEAGRELRF